MTYVTWKHKAEILMSHQLNRQTSGLQVKEWELWEEEKESSFFPSDLIQCIN